MSRVLRVLPEGPCQRIRGRRTAALAGSLLAAGALRAEPPVIYDTGAARPLVAYVAPLEPAPRAPRPIDLAGVAAHLFPIRTPELTPGPVAPAAANFPALAQPLFIVGSDPLSRQWLSSHRDRLRALNAVGLLIAAESEADYAAMARLAAGLKLAPVPGSELAATLKLAHYPVLISAGRIEQ